jgi:hypothetical protein
MDIELGADEVLTQYGNRTYPRGQPFRNRPRPGKETAISLIRGRLSVDEVFRVVNRGTDKAYDDDGARYTTVGELRAAGFRVGATPSRLIPGHVSVTLDDETAWTDDVCVTFSACFTEPAWKGGAR